MSSSPQLTEYQQRRKLFMNSHIRKSIRDEIITQARCTVRHLSGTHFEVVVKKRRDANGELMNAWRPSLVRYKNDNDANFWTIPLPDAEGVMHDTEEAALRYMLERLQELPFRGITQEGSGLSDDEHETDDGTSEEGAGEEGAGEGGTEGRNTDGKNEAGHCTGGSHAAGEDARREDVAGEVMVGEDVGESMDL